MQEGAAAEVAEDAKDKATNVPRAANVEMDIRIAERRFTLSFLYLFTALLGSLSQ